MFQNAQFNINDDQIMNFNLYSMKKKLMNQNMTKKKIGGIT